MKFHQPEADLFIPAGIPLEEAARGVTHLGIGAHQDDLEFMALHGILACYRQDDQAFAGVVCTDGRGSARQGPYAGSTDDQMREIRREEQRAAARIGEYRLMAQLDYSSADLRSPRLAALQEDLHHLLATLRPRVVYTHNPADKHPTHLAVLAATLAALRALPPEARPAAVHGCEVWRGLDWMDDNAKQPLDVSGHEHLTAALYGVFDSQIAGGKRYDLATVGRSQANATFYHSHAVDAASRLVFAMDLTPLVENPALDVVAFTLAHIDRFRQDVQTKLTAALLLLHGNHHPA